MSTTSVTPTNRKWLRRLLSGRPHQIIGGADDPYLLRWHIIPRNPVLNVYLHKFLRSDDDRALHDHPWWFASLMLRGRYDEITSGGVRRRRAGSIALRRARWRHRVQLHRQAAGPAKTNRFGVPDQTFGPEEPCWTLIVTGRRRRLWGFWCPQPAWPGASPRHTVHRFVPWNKFGDAGCGESA